MSYRPRLRGERRDQERAVCQQLYDLGLSIREVAAQRDLSFGVCRTLLGEAGVNFRAKGGDVRSQNARRTRGRRQVT